ncbi:MAG: IS110 family transposase [Deltaproteobacteria bacterium]|nr:MAG: IS110 family transposase [Deltaproteobacteria bacterium]
MDSKTQKGKRVNKETLIVAVDIGKQSHYGYFRTPEGQEVSPFCFSNTCEGFERFYKKLYRFQTAQGLRRVLVGFESTGVYAEPLLHFLRAKPVELVQINPMHTKRMKELTGNSPNKTDRKDPRVIADVMMLGHFLTVVVPVGAAAELRRLTHARQRAIKQRTAMINQLQHLIFIIFPELLQVIKNVSCKTGLYLAAHYPTPQAIVALGLQSLTRAMQRVSCGKLDHHRAVQLYQAARQSVGVTEASEAIVTEIKYLVEQIQQANGFVQRLEGQMLEYVNQIPYSRYLLSMKGIGLVTVAGLIGEVGDFREFSTISEITKLGGLDLYEISSGKHKGQRRISKRGRPLMRKLLYFAAINTVRANGIMHAPYQRMVARGMPKMKALVAIARKLLGVMFALVRDQALYEKNFNVHRYQLAA